MIKRIGGQFTEKGVYISLRTGEFIMVPKEGRELPGEAKVKYVKVPLAAAVILGPIIGLSYVIFLPFIGLLALGWMIGRLAGRGVHALRGKTGELAGSELQPGMANFARDPKKPADKKAEGGLEGLEKEIEQKKQQK
jgi:hypothetical protein